MKSILRFTLVAIMSILTSCQTITGSGEVTVVWDNEKSFQDGAIAVTAIAGAVISAGVSKAQEVTSQKATAGSNALKTVESNNKTAEVLGGQKTSIELAKIPKDL